MQYNERQNTKSSLTSTLAAGVVVVVVVVVGVDETNDMRERRNGMMKI